jgi:glycosyltransferase involved in cell wall biosynthesis
MKSLKICIVASTYPRNESDYAVPWLRESVRRLTDRGHRVTVLAPSFRGLKDRTVDGVPVRRFRYAPAALETLTHEEGAPSKVGKLSRKLLGIPYVVCGRWAAARLCDQQHFDIVHVHWPFPHAAIGSVIAKRCKAPLILNSHGAEFAMARKMWWVKAWLRRSLLGGDLLLANSSDTANHIRALSGREAIVLPYGSTVPDRFAEHLQNAVPRVLFTGRLIERKGVEYLIRAIPRILARRPVKVVITGNGDQKVRLEAMTASMGLGDAVQFLGFVSLEQLDEEYAACDVWVNPAIVDSRGDTEGLGVGAIDAYSHGKPVVASAVGGIPDAVVHRETGLLVPEKDENALADGILEIVNNPKWGAKLGQQGREFASRKFSWEGIIGRLEAIYVNAIADLANKSKSAVVGAG